MVIFYYNCWTTVYGIYKGSTEVLSVEIVLCYRVTK
jgi:hypothetical protein